MTEQLFYICISTIIILRIIANIALGVHAFLCRYKEEQGGTCLVPLWILDLFISGLSLLFAYFMKYKTLVILYGSLLLFISHIYLLFVAQIVWHIRQKKSCDE